MKKLVLILLIVSSAISPVFGQKKTQLIIGTASMGGAFYPVGQEIANLVTKYSDNFSMVPVVTGGAVENPRLLISGDIDIGITNANIAYFAYSGLPPYDKKLDIACVASLYPSVLHIATLAKSSIKSIADLKGKRLAVGPAGGGTLDILKAILDAYGMTIKDIVPSYLSYEDGFSQMADGNVDAALALSGYPASAVMQTIATNKIRFIEIEQDKLASIMRKYSYYSDITVNKNVYKTDNDVVMIGVQNVLIVKRSMPEDAVYKITKAVFDNLPEFAASNANGKQIDKVKAAQVPIPMNPGALKYFQGK
jgi:TRAP transporter TAXI family solute receptor